jgi:transposase
VGGKGSGRQRLLPSAETLEQMRKQGMTFQQIADDLHREFGYRVTRQAVSVALRRGKA